MRKASQAKTAAKPRKAAASKASRTPQVAVLMGSANDKPLMAAAGEILREMRIPFEQKVLSAHRAPQALAEYAAMLPARGIKCVIAGAGGAAHLAGALAAHSQLPILGVPLAATPLAGFDALLATVQMPRGIPVATFAVGGAANAALFAAAMLALGDDALARRLADFRARQTARSLQAS